MCIRDSVTATDKLAQILHYLALECTTQQSICGTCSSKSLTLLAQEVGRMRVMEWWCGTCRSITRLNYTAPTMDDKFTESLGVGRFTGLRFLSLPLAPADAVYLCNRLPGGRAEGNDGLPYELIQEAPEEAQLLLGEAYNEILAGAELPEEWGIQVQQYLFKREPEEVMENVRPVRLMTTSYKGLTSTIDSRLKKEMEHLGMLELPQFAFRHGFQAQEPIVQLQHAIEDARQSKGKIYIALLDWYSAFDTVDLGRLYLLFERLGMHPDDVNLLRRAHRGAWVTVRTPFGDTARIQVTRGTAQGCSLSPSLFCFFLNLCLRHIATSGVGFHHIC